MQDPDTGQAKVMTVKERHNFRHSISFSTSNSPAFRASLWLHFRADAAFQVNPQDSTTYTAPYQLTHRLRYSEGCLTNNEWLVPELSLETVLNSRSENTELRPRSQHQLFCFLVPSTLASPICQQRQQLRYAHAIHFHPHLLCRSPFQMLNLSYLFLHRIHLLCELHFQSDKYHASKVVMCLVTLQSTNGSWINGARVSATQYCTHQRQLLFTYVELYMRLQW